jgi:hypothetical protein
MRFHRLAGQCSCSSYSFAVAVLTLFFIGAMASTNAHGQTIFTPGQTYFGTNNYIEYIVGNLPIIISAAHGGDMSPPEIPTRNCSACVTVADAATQELVRAMGASMQRLFGCSPHIIINRLHRRKLDANREMVEAAQGNPQAERAWNEFHQFIDSAKRAVERSFGRGFYLDMHGHGHDIQRLELGYLLREDELRLPDDSLNKGKYIGFSSIRNLVGTNKQGALHARLLRGDGALGTLFGQRGYPAVPSKQDPAPKAGDDYFDGGYNTARHSSYRGGTIDGIQIECNFAGVRDSPTAIRRFADSLAVVMQQFLRLYYAFPLPNACAITSVAQTHDNRDNTDTEGAEIVIFPQPATQELRFRLPPDWTGCCEITILNVLGNVVLCHRKEYLAADQEYALAADALPSGVYAVRVQSCAQQTNFATTSRKMLQTTMMISR